jgi:hypothetical protein
MAGHPSGAVGASAFTLRTPADGLHALWIIKPMMINLGVRTGEQ